jgi:exopolyphosphatase/guanosine-5'-triphosphate,3'-diphosphate pyrophosphatase
VKIGAGGISKGIISEEGLKRGLKALNYFKDVIDGYPIKSTRAIGTSAMRNASNSNILMEQMQEWGWTVEIIHGAREAELIYKGIALDPEIPSHKSTLIMDIGGGSVEFIIGSNSQINWSRSYEIGAQRLKDRFHSGDLISENEIQQLNTFLETELSELQARYQTLKPEMFIGSSGTFDTLLSVRNKNFPSESNFISGREYSGMIKSFIETPLIDRQHIPGMIPERAEMIVSAGLLLKFVLEHLKISGFYVSSHALKEGLIYEELHPNT